MFDKRSEKFLAGMVIFPSFSTLTGIVEEMPISKSVALIVSFPFFTSKRKFERIGSCPLVETAWFKKEILFCKLSERKVIFIYYLFVVVVVYLEKWEKARRRG
jgi:hypothetical protein